MYKQPCFIESAIKVPIAAPSAGTSGEELIIAKTAGIATAGLNCPLPHGETIQAVVKQPIAYRAAHNAIKTIVRAFLC